MPNTLNNLIHVAYILTRQGRHTLYLRRSEKGSYSWNQLDETEQETPSPVTANSAEEAIRLGRGHWKEDSFTPLHCGFRFTLPERDEIGGNALFHQMTASYSSINGVYLDEELSHQCIVYDASQEALALWARLRGK